MKISVDKSFERDIKKLPIKVQKQVKRIIQKLSATASLMPFPVNLQADHKFIRYPVTFHIGCDCISV